MSRIKPSGNVTRYEAGSSNVTYSNNAPNAWTSLAITNDGASDLTVTIHGMPIIVKPNEQLNEDFVDFNSVQITTTVAYRLMLRS
jgi:hypothetical protein